jgi:site-specific DNA recombinase
MSKTAALYARVSSDHQREQNTIASQTAALLEYAQTHHYAVPPEWMFQDEGYSGSVLARPGLERLRDLIAEGALETVLIYAPDRLSRSYAYQVLLLEEFARRGTEVVFLKAPAADTPEQRLLLQFQGMIAEYERAQIAERCRRGKRHRAKAGHINVLASSAPYGYRYVKKTETAQAFYQVVESEAEVVREIFRRYAVEGQSLRAMARALNERKVATRSQKAPWGAPTLWCLINNPAYQGRACYGKTQAGPPTARPNRTSRRHGPYARRSPVRHRRPSQEWIEIPVPALVSQETFDLAQERFKSNRELSARRTKTPTVLQGLLVCAHCGYAWCSGAHGREPYRYRYYRCAGKDQRRDGQPACASGPVRVEVLDQLVWDQVWQLLNQPELIAQEIERRLAEHRTSSPVEQRKEKVSRDLARVEQQSDKLLDAYQEGLMDLAELRQRAPEVRKRQLALQKEWESLNLQALERDRLAQVTVSMEKLMEQIQHTAQTLGVEQKQRIVRLLVRQVQVGDESITIHHSIPLFGRSDGQNLPTSSLCMSRHIVTFVDNQQLAEAQPVTLAVTTRHQAVTWPTFLRYFASAGSDCCGP